jgi:hypothetical protein
METDHKENYFWVKGNTYGDGVIFWGRNFVFKEACIKFLLLRGNEYAEQSKLTNQMLSMSLNAYINHQFSKYLHQSVNISEPSNMLCYSKFLHRLALFCTLHEANYT